MDVDSIKKDFVQQGDTHRSKLQQNKVSSLSGAAKEWLDRDANCFLHQALSTPVMNVLSSAEGAFIYDLDGNKYLDLHGNGVHNVGFNNPDVIKAVIHQLTSELTFAPRRYTSIPTIKFAEKLIGLAPEGLDRALFCPGGSEAIEMAVMLAKHVTGRYKTISFWNQYHGNTMQAATLSGNEHFTSGMGPMVPGAFHVRYPSYYRNPWNIPATETERIDAAYLNELRIVFEHNPDIAAVIGTTISSTPCVPSLHYWRQVKQLCEANGTLLVFDEIVCGLGRTGKLFACEHYVTPDVLVLGKSLGGGIIPFAGILTRQAYNVVSAYSIGHYTHEKSPIASAAALAMLEFMENERLVENACQQGQYLLDGFLEMKRAYEVIGHVEGRGLLISLDLVKGGAHKERHQELAEDILGFCLQNGVSFKVIDGNVITLRPSLIISREDADFILDTFLKAFQHTLAGQV